MDLTPEQWKLVAAVAAALVVLVGVLAFASSRAKAIGRRLVMVARDAGWQNPEPMKFLAAGVRGQWNGFDAAIRRIPRQKAIPEKVITLIWLQVPARLFITRRMHGFRGGRPFTMFGPPLVELRSGAGAEFWIRADEASLAERLFASADLPALLERNLVSRFDVMALAGDSLRIVRAFVGAGFGGVSSAQLALTAREELDLARATVEALALRP